MSPVEVSGGAQNERRSETNLGTLRTIEYKVPYIEIPEPPDIYHGLKIELGEQTAALIAALNRITELEGKR